MNCPHCSAPLMIEDAFCSFCGKENPYFKQHREDLQEFTEEFEETQQEVLEKVQHSSRMSVSTILICVLIILNALVLFATINIWEVQYAYDDWKVNQKEAEHRAAIQAYSDAGDALGLASYFNRQVSIYGTALEDYYQVQRAAQQYEYIYKCIVQLTLLQDHSYQEPEELCEEISDDLASFFSAITQDDYEDEAQFTEEHLATMAMLQEKLEVLIEGYLNIPAEDIPALLELSDARRAIAIEEGVLGHES